MIDNKFSWDLHINEMVTKLNMACYVIRTFKSFLSLEELRMIYFSSVHSFVSFFGVLNLILKLHLKSKKE
jgi:hypothetical protein